MYCVVVGQPDGRSQVAGPYTAFHRAKGIYDELRGLDLPAELVAMRNWVEINTDIGRTVKQVLEHEREIQRSEIV